MKYTIIKKNEIKIFGYMSLQHLKPEHLVESWQRHGLEFSTFDALQISTRKIDLENEPMHLE